MNRIFLASTLGAVMLALSACAPQASTATQMATQATAPLHFTLSTTPRSFVPTCASLNVRDTTGRTLLATLSGNAQVVLNEASAPGKVPHTVSFLVECLQAGKVTSSGIFTLKGHSFKGTLLHSDSPDFKDDGDQDIYEIPSMVGDTYLPVSVRIDKFE